MVRNGRYLPADDPLADPGRTLERLGQRLARILAEIHRRGVVMHDLAPKKIVVVDADHIGIVDFGLADYDGSGINGSTPGYAPARQRRGEPALDVDDLHALGMTLLSAAIYVSPVSFADDHDIPRQRALQLLRARFGPAPTGVIAIVADLLSGEDEIVRAAARCLAGNMTRTAKTALPSLPVVTGELATEITDNLLADVLVRTDEILSGTTGNSTAYDASVYTGTAGIGLELLEHVDRPGVPERITQLAAFTLRAATAVHLQPGLLLGRTGVDIFLQRAQSLGIDIPGHPGPVIPGDRWHTDIADLIGGSAGSGSAIFFCMATIVIRPIWLWSGGAYERCWRPIQSAATQIRSRPRRRWNRRWAARTGWPGSPNSCFVRARTIRRRRPRSMISLSCW